VKAQQVKNAVIVPVGAKGGFCRSACRPAPDARAPGWRGHRAYKIFISRAARHHRQSRRRRGRAAADVCGAMATIPISSSPPTRARRPSPTSPTASRRHGFWLGDAFASGGSVGYDHKKMGITARGAWEAVKRHFREMGHRHPDEPFTVVGVGDMSGDVFGNGMLLSKQIQAGRRLRPPRHLHRSQSRSGGASWAERKRCSTCRARAGRTTTSR
jgi:glutamate dehydrogenase